MHTPTLTKLLEGDELELYIAVLEATVSSILLRSKGASNFPSITSAMRL